MIPFPQQPTSHRCRFVDDWPNYPIRTPETSQDCEEQASFGKLAG
jgi:hypothetical protein